jgi:hypothetical protein
MGAIVAHAAAMRRSQYKDYVLVLLFIKYISGAEGHDALGTGGARYSRDIGRRLAAIKGQSTAGGSTGTGEHPVSAQAKLLREVVPIWRGFAGQFLQRSAIGRDRLLQRAVPSSRSPSVLSAVPRLFCAFAQSSGTRARVPSSNRPRLPPPNAPSRSRAPRASRVQCRDCFASPPSSGARSRVYSFNRIRQMT